MITVIDSVMGSGKTTWAINELLDKNLDKNILYVTPYLEEIERIKEKTIRRIESPENYGKGKLDNISNLMNWQMDIASTHELLKRFDEKCKAALKENEYTLILDETISAVTPYTFDKKDDYLYLLKNHDIKINDDGMIVWTGDSELDTRFNDVRTLAKNKCLFQVDGKFFLWHFPIEIFKLFKDVFILTYLFSGSLMKNYFDLYDLQYSVKSIAKIGDEYRLVDFYKPDKQTFRNRINIYEGKLTQNISQKNTMLSASWSKSTYNQKDLQQIQKNLFNFSHNIIKAKSDDIMWTSHKSTKKRLCGKGYTNSFIPCNARASNNYKDRTCLMYALNWYENPEIKKFFEQHNITVNQDLTALAALIQWIWRSNIRVPFSDKIINVYIPSKRMRNLLKDWLYDRV